MSLLICEECKQVPYIEFQPGLTIQFMCCKSLLIRHTNLGKLIEKSYNLKCFLCKNNSENINYISKTLICDNCLAKKNIKSCIKEENIPNICPEHGNRYNYYEPKTHRLYCEYCKLPSSSISVEEYKKELDFSISKYNVEPDYFAYFTYYTNLIKRINKTFEVSKRKSYEINAYLNLLNLKEFIEKFSIISPLCQNCKEIYQIDYIEKNENKILDISCKCDKYSFFSINEFENKINSIICDECQNIFCQNKMFFDFLTEKKLCEKCLNEKNSFDYILFNEIAYICNLHKNKFNFYCEKCGKFFCNECKNFDNHKLIEIIENKEDNKILNILDKSKCLIKLKQEGFLNLKHGRDICFNNNNKNIDEDFKKFKRKIEKKENNDLYYLSVDFKDDILFTFDNIQNLCWKVPELKLEEKIFELEKKICRLEFSVNILFKEFSDKNKVVELLKTRNIIQHLLANMIKKRYDCFKKINADFRILYESFKYLNYEKKNDEGVKVQLDSIFEKFEKMIKNTIFKNIKKCLCNNLIKEKEQNELLNTEEKKTKTIFDTSNDEKKNFDIKKEADKIKFESIYQYNNFLKNQHMISKKLEEKNESTIKTIKNIENNIIPEDIEKTGLFKFVNFKENDYSDKFGYINEKTSNKKLIEEMLNNDQKDGSYESHQYLFLKKNKKDEFLKELNCENEYEFEFYFILLNNIINRIGKIIHQNDFIFQHLFNDINDNLNINNYNLIKDEENQEIKFHFENKNKYNSLRNLDFKEFNLLSLDEFINNFINCNIPKIKKLLGSDCIQKIKAEIKAKLPNISESDDIHNDINLYENKIEEYIIFLNECKELFELFPKLKGNINNIIEKNNIQSLFERKYKINYTEKREDNYFINTFSKLYIFTIYCKKKLKHLTEGFEKQYSKYNELLDNYFQLELSKILFELFVKLLNIKDNVPDFFEQEKKNTFELFQKIIINDKDISSEQDIELSEAQKELFKKEKEKKRKKYEEMIKKMKDISLKDIGKIFENFSDYDLYSYADTKLDVLLFLCQNKYI